MMVGLLAPILVLAAAFGIDVICWYGEALHLQGVADRAAVSAGPLWQGGDQNGAIRVANVLAGDVTLDRIDAAAGGERAGRRGGVEVIVSCRKRRLLANLWAPGRQTARAVAVGSRLVE